MIESKLSDKIVGYQPTVDASHQMSGVLNCLVLVQDSDHQDRDQDGESTVSRLFRRDSDCQVWLRRCVAQPAWR